MLKRNRKKVKDLVEMLQDPESLGYVGSDIDELELYDPELAELEELGENLDDNYVSEGGFE